MDQAQWAQTEIALLPTEQIALRPSVQQKPLSHMPLETLAASMAREGLREPILVRAAAQGYIIVEGNRRLMACRMLGWREIPARVQPKDVSDMTSVGEIFAALRARPMGYLDLTIVSIPGVARIARSQALLAREQTYAEAMTAVGASRTRILWRHILPNILSPIIVQMTFTFATAIISEASLSFLGAGIPSPYPSWGGMLNEARGYVYMGWWMIVFPAIFTALSVLGFNLFGDGLRDLIDPLSGR